MAVMQFVTMLFPAMQKSFEFEMICLPVFFFASNLSMSVSRTPIKRKASRGVSFRILIPYLFPFGWVYTASLGLSTSFFIVVMNVMLLLSMFVLMVGQMPCNTC